MADRLHLFIDEENLSFRADVIGPTLRHRSALVNNAVSLCDFLSRIAEDGVVQLKRFGELLVQLGGVAAGGKVGNIERTKGVAALTERLALRRSATGKCLGKPRDHNRLLAPEIRQLVGLAV